MPSRVGIGVIVVGVLVLGAGGGCGDRASSVAGDASQLGDVASGASCGDARCSPTQTCCFHQRFEPRSRCVDLQQHPENCGVCGHVCDPAICQAGQCAEPETTCDGGPQLFGGSTSCCTVTFPTAGATVGSCPAGTECISSDHPPTFNGCCPIGELCGCDYQAPKAQCPVSRRATKREIRYQSPAELEGLHRAVLELRPARYRYRTDPGAEHLGFIIDDLDGLQRAAVHPDGEHVDLYGYTTMLVAALQVQAKQIEALRREVQELNALKEPKARR